MFMARVETRSQVIKSVYDLYFYSVINYYQLLSISVIYFALIRGGVHEQHCLDFFSLNTVQNNITCATWASFQWRD